MRNLDFVYITIIATLIMIFFYKHTNNEYHKELVELKLQVATLENRIIDLQLDVVKNIKLELKKCIEQ